MLNGITKHIMRFKLVAKEKTWWTEREGPLEDLFNELALCDVEVELWLIL